MKFRFITHKLCFFFVIIIISTVGLTVGASIEYPVKSILEPNNGDFLHYNATVIDQFGMTHQTTWNLTFFTEPFLLEIEGITYEVNDTLIPGRDLVKIIHDIGDWNLMLPGFEGPDGKWWWMVDTSNRDTWISDHQTLEFNFDVIWDFHFMVPKNLQRGFSVKIEGDFHEIKDAGNIQIGLDRYPVWIFTTWDGYMHFEANSGILLYEYIEMENYDYKNSYLTLIEGKIGDIVIPETIDTCSIKIIIQDIDDNPIESATVSSTTTPEQQNLLSGITSNSGTIEFSKIKQGTYTFQASKEGFETTSQSIVTDDSGTFYIEITLEKIQSGFKIPGFSYISICIGIILGILILAQKRT